ncbi:hypothetical protein P872_11515 [Rhodonellum psychrophilum GCM71 = DSM 17998]|uniref:O-antigen polymerase n=2 Tax=Rhodonellum TaxID=336827 RepID=U5BT02_9BACT|nr:MULTISPECIES: hypothetical protein [Rhodonellum]ERM81023.1 hypothetical protein P872_11515 [Rhodonellum psychrophilum GCM71 = DSM 17998]SDZ41567.1 hypothetical protein SAMN05444412_113132 [Rhodonellum ikkaensis]
MRNKIYLLFVIILIPFNLKFFDASFINPVILNYSFILFIWITIFLSIPHVFKQKSQFSIPILLIFFSVLLSMVMAYYSWNQNFFYSFIETSQYMIWPLFFLLVYQDFSISHLEKIILAYGLLYALLFFFQYLNQGTVFFGKPLYGDEWTEDRGVIRIIFPGAGIFILSLFIAITKLTTTKNHRWFWILFILLGVIIPVMQVTRQFIAGILLIYLFHLIINVNLTKKIVIIFFFILAVGIVINSDIPMVQGVIEAQERDSSLGKKYIRILAGEYFLFDYSPNTVSAVFGNGAPYWGLSDYGKFHEYLADNKGFYLSDVGIIAVYAMFGIFAIIGFVLIWVNSFFIRIPPEYQYSKYYLWYILFTSFTWYSVYHYHYLISTVFALYIFHKGIEASKRKRLLKRVIKKILSEDNNKTLNNLNAIDQL